MSEPVASTESVSVGPTVLVVEDNEDLRENAVLVLRLEGFNALSATDGQDALDQLMTGKCEPDLIVSDIAMPRLDGYGFFDAVHKIPALRTIPFIFLTARGSRRDIRFGKELGVDDYLVKPFNAEDFLIAIRSKLRRNQEIREQAESKLDDARRRLVQLLSHELRTPLTYVTGGFSLLAEGLEQDELPNDMQLSMGLIRSGTQRLTRLAEQLVLYAELISGHSKLQMDILGEPLDLSLLLQEIVSLAKIDYSSRSISFVQDIDTSDTIEVFTVSDMLRMGLNEVLRNAATYCDENSEVHVGLKRDGNYAVIQIADQGRGIAPEDQADIWEILIQSERIKHEQQGAGMGLPIVKQIMLLHGGNVALESVVDQGTSVTLRLPVFVTDAGKSAPKTQRTL